MIKFLKSALLKAREGMEIQVTTTVTEEDIIVPWTRMEPMERNQRAHIWNIF